MIENLISISIGKMEKLRSSSTTVQLSFILKTYKAVKLVLLSPVAWKKLQINNINSLQKIYKGWNCVLFWNKNLCVDINDYFEADLILVN